MNLVRKSRVNFQISASFYGNTAFCTSFLFWLQILHTNSDFYRLYITEKGISRSTTSVLKIFSKSDPKQPRTSENSSSFMKLRILPHLSHVKQKYYLFITQKSGPPIYISTIHSSLSSNQTQKFVSPFLHQKTPTLLKIQRCYKQIFGWNQPKL